MGVAAATRVVCLSVLCLCVGVRGFYIPGVAPTEYEEGDKLEIKVMLSVWTSSVATTSLSCSSEEAATPS
jgi:hypothetical protein